MNFKVTARDALYALLMKDVGINIESMSKSEFEDAIAECEEDCDLFDSMCDLRCSGESTNLQAPWSRHYETEQVAAETPFGWVSWTYWYGGGKHGNPEEIDWIEDAFFVDVEEKQVMVTQRSFTKREEV